MSLQRPIVRPAMQETTALGVARLAMNAAGIKPEIEINERRFEPNGELQSEFERWSAARRAVQSIPPRLNRLKRSWPPHTMT